MYRSLNGFEKRLFRVAYDLYDLLDPVLSVEHGDGVMRNAELLQLSEHDVSEAMQLVDARLRQTNAVVGDTLRMRRHDEQLRSSQPAPACTAIVAQSMQFQFCE